MLQTRSLGCQIIVMDTRGTLRLRKRRLHWKRRVRSYAILTRMTWMKGCMRGAAVYNPVSVASGAFLTDQEGENISMQRRNAMLLPN
jgi:hypothetical protein